VKNVIHYNDLEAKVFDDPYIIVFNSILIPLIKVHLPNNWDQGSSLKVLIPFINGI